MPYAIVGILLLVPKEKQRMLLHLWQVAHRWSLLHHWRILIHHWTMPRKNHWSLPRVHPWSLLHRVDHWSLQRVHHSWRMLLHHWRMLHRCLHRSPVKGTLHPCLRSPWGVPSKHHHHAGSTNSHRNSPSNCLCNLGISRRLHCIQHTPSTGSDVG